MIKKVIVISIIILFFLLLVFAWTEYHRIKNWQRYEKRMMPPSRSAAERENYLLSQLEMEKLRKVGKYQTFRSPEFASMFLLDTIEGKIWVLVRDPKTKKLSWQRLEVEGEKEENRKAMRLK